MREDLDFTPVNRPLSNIATDLQNKKAVLVELQPGDATRYLFFLIPMWNDDLRPSMFGISPPDEWIWVVPANLRTVNGGAAVRFTGLDTGAIYDLSEVYESSYTRLIISHFLSLLHPLVVEE